MTTHCVKGFSCPAKALDALFSQQILIRRGVLDVVVEILKRHVVGAGLHSEGININIQERNLSMLRGFYRSCSVARANYFLEGPDGQWVIESKSHTMGDSVGDVALHNLNVIP